MSTARYQFHGGRETRLYSIWKNMLTRCRNAKNRDYKMYGGRGITVCPEWSKFTVFREQMGDPPPGTSIERIDNSQGYSKENCRWATGMEQSRNTRRNRTITARGKTLCIAEWAEITGLEYQTIRRRLRNGWNDEEIVNTPLIYRRK